MLTVPRVSEEQEKILDASRSRTTHSDRRETPRRCAETLSRSRPPRLQRRGADTINRSDSDRRPSVSLPRFRGSAAAAKRCYISALSILLHALIGSTSSSDFRLFCMLPLSLLSRRCAGPMCSTVASWRRHASIAPPKSQAYLSCLLAHQCSPSDLDVVVPCRSELPQILLHRHVDSCIQYSWHVRAHQMGSHESASPIAPSLVLNEENAAEHLDGGSAAKLAKVAGDAPNM